MLSFSEGAKAQQAPVSGGPVYRIKPSDIVVPQDVPLGQYRRIFRPFENWTLICDENLKLNQMVCNVSQSIMDATGEVVFSWSLAAAAGGQPFFILRTMPDADTKTEIELKLDAAKTPVKATFDGCSKAVCVAKTPIGPLLSKAIEQGSEVVISYRTLTGQMRAMRLPFKGLNEAVTSIGGGSAAAQPPRPAAKPDARNANRPAKAPPAKRDAGQLSVPPAARQ